MKKSAKIFIKIITALLAVIIVICATLGIYYAASKDCSLTVNVNTEKELQEISGWGTSDCWWADNIDDEQTRNEIANLLFSEDGLNLDTYRYCLYGGYDPENNVVDSQWRLGESFYVYNSETGEYEYDWSRDANSQAIFDYIDKVGTIATPIDAPDPAGKGEIEAIGKTTAEELRYGYLTAEEATADFVSRAESILASN